MPRTSAKPGSLKRAKPSAERRIAAFEKEMLKLETRIFELEAENARLKARIKVLENAGHGYSDLTEAELSV